MKKTARLRLIIILAIVAMLCISIGVTIACLNANQDDSSQNSSNSSGNVQNSSITQSSIPEQSSNQNSNTSSENGDDPSLDKDISTILLGEVRIQLLSNTVVRIENKGAKGFEDRPSYIVQNRNNWESIQYVEKQENGENLIVTNNYTIHIPLNGKAESAYITDSANEILWRYSDAGNTDTNVYLPSPSDELKSWYFTDSPRVIPSEYGYSINNEDNTPLQGWDFDNNATDAFIFLPQGDYTKFCDDYIKLTGESEMTPLQMLGYWDSRWYAYSSETALQQI